MSTNRKPGQAVPQPTEPIKRAVSAALRALARAPNCEVTFAADRPALIEVPGAPRVRLGEPPRKPSAGDIAILRGQADSYALKLACHDPRVHRRHAPEQQTARAVFDLAQLLLACYHGDRAAQHALRVSAATVQRFFAPVLVPGLRTTWGLGWDHPDPHPPVGSDAGSTSSAGRLWSRAGVGHLGFTGCSVWLDPALRAVAVLVSNRVCVATSAEAEQTKAGMRRLRPQLHDALMLSWQQPR